jgi:hypothetical protein
LNVSFRAGSRSWPALAGPGRIDVVEQARRHERHEDDAGRVELGEPLDPPAEPGRHPLERVGRRELGPDPFQLGVEVLHLDEARAAAVGRTRQGGDERRSLGQRLDREHLSGLDIGAHGDDQVGVPLEDCSVHPATRYCGSRHAPL